MLSRIGRTKFRGNVSCFHTCVIICGPFVTANQLLMSMSNSNATADLSDRIDAAVARVNLALAQQIVDLAGNIPPDNVTEDTLAQVMVSL